MVKSAFHVASKSIDDVTAHRVTTAITTGLCVGYNKGVIASAGAPVWGIAKSDATLGGDALLGVIGTVPGKLGGAVAVGDALISDATGRLVVAAAGQNIIGRALGAGVADDFIEIQITREGTA